MHHFDGASHPEFRGATSHREAENVCANRLKEGYWIKRPNPPKWGTQIFIQGLVNKIVDASWATIATTKRKTYRKWSEGEKDMALHIAQEKGSDSLCGEHQEISASNQREARNK